MRARRAWRDAVQTRRWSGYDHPCPRSVFTREAIQLAWVAAITVGTACAGTFGTAVPSSPLELRRGSTEVIGHASDVELTLANRGSRPLLLPWPPDPFLVVHANPETVAPPIPCSAPPPLPKTLGFIELRPGRDLNLHVDLAARCAVSPHAEYTAELRYVVPADVRTRFDRRGAWIGASEPVWLHVSPSLRAAEVPPAVPPAPLSSAVGPGVGTPHAGSEPAPSAGPTIVTRCPLEVPESSVEVVDTPAGVALTFATNPPYVAALRESVRSLGEAFNHRDDPNDAPAGTGTSLGADASAVERVPAPLPPAQATSEPLPRGASLDIVPGDIADLGLLRRGIRQRWRSGQMRCGAFDR